MTEDFKAGYLAAVGYVEIQKNFLRLSETNVQRRRSWQIAYNVLIDDLMEHFKYNEGLDETHT